MGILACIAVLGLASCKTDPTSTPISTPTPSSTSGGNTVNDYYRSENFKTSDKEIHQTIVKTYEGPSLMESSSQVKISVEGQDLFVYETRVNHARSFSYEYSKDFAPMAIFDFQGPIDVEIEVPGVKLNSARISPLVYGIEPVLDGDTMKFTLEYPTNYTIEYNNDSSKAIHLFANPLEEDPITEEEAAKDDNIVYFGPGVYKTDGIPVKDGQTVYLAGGSVVYGQMILDSQKDITIRGRGILSGEIYDRKTADQLYIPLEVRNSQNFLIEGITILDPAGWAVALKKSSDITIDNLHIISARANSDGISVQSCSDITVKNSYVRSWDDSLVVKNVERGDTHDILFDNNIVWTDLAQSMEVGYETYGAIMDNIVFKNTTVVHNFHKPVISLHNCDDAHITNVSYENITLEDGQMLGDSQNDGENDFFIDFTIAFNSEWTKSEGIRGSVEGVKIKNVKVYEMADSVQSRMLGESAASNIKDVEISNIEIEGKKINNASDLKLTTNDFVNSLSITKGSGTLGAIIPLPYKIGTISTDSKVDVVQGIEQSGVIVPEAYYVDGLAYLGVQNNRSGYELKATHGVGTLNTSPYDDGTGDYTIESNPTSNLIDGDKKTTWKAKDWTDENNDFIALTINMSQTELKTVGVIRLFAPEGNKYYEDLSFSVFGRRNKTDGTPNPDFVRVLSTAEYSISPGSGNAIDIKFTARGYYELQIRFFEINSMTACSQLEFSEIEFYPPSLTYNKVVVDATEHNDVYTVEKLIDGDTTGTSYYEASSMPAYVVIDMQALYDIKCVVLCLPPMTSWPARTQRIEVQYSNSNSTYNSDSTKFTSLIGPQDYTFDPMTNGNMWVIDLENSVQARFIKVIITSNDVTGGYGAQLSEISVYQG